MADDTVSATVNVDETGTAQPGSQNIASTRMPEAGTYLISYASNFAANADPEVTPLYPNLTARTTNNAPDSCVVQTFNADGQPDPAAFSFSVTGTLTG